MKSSVTWKPSGSTLKQKYGNAPLLCWNKSWGTVIGRPVTQCEVEVNSSGARMRPDLVADLPFPVKP